MRDCPVCSLHVCDLLYTVPTGQLILACPTCGMVYADGGPSVDYSKDSIYTCAETYPAQTWHYKMIVARCFRAGFDIPVLDVGCALGGLMQAFVDRGFKNVYGISLSQGEVDACRARGLKADVSTAAKQKCTFGVVTLTHVLEHVPDVQGLLRDLRRCIADDGLLYIEVPDASAYATHFTSIAQGFNSEHINHFDLHQLNEACFHAGMEAVSSGAYTVPIDTGGSYPVIWTLAQPRRDTGALRDHIMAYVSTLEHQVERVENHLAKELDGLATYAIWGLGQTTSLLVDSGIIDLDKIHWLADTNPIFGHLPQDFHPPAYVPILVCSQTGRTSIIASIRKLGLTNRIITLEE